MCNSYPLIRPRESYAAAGDRAAKESGKIPGGLFATLYSFGYMAALLGEDRERTSRRFHLLLALHPDGAREALLSLLDSGYDEAERRRKALVEVEPPRW